MYPQHIQEAAAAIGRTLTESDTPLYGSGLRLPDEERLFRLSTISFKCSFGLAVYGNLMRLSTVLRIFQSSVSAFEVSRISV